MNPVYIMETWEDADLAGWIGPGWYFWDETASICYGPYNSEREAFEAQRDYYRRL
jgi:hypothetical protein